MEGGRGERVVRAFRRNSGHRVPPRWPVWPARGVARFSATGRRARVRRFYQLVAPSLDRNSCARCAASGERAAPPCTLSLYARPHLRLLASTCSGVGFGFCSCFFT